MWLAGAAGAATLAGLWLLRVPTASAQARQLTVYTRESSSSTELVEIAGQEYVDLGSVLLGVGKASLHSEQKRYKVGFGGQEAVFEDGSPSARMGRIKLALGAPFVLQGGRGFVPLGGLAEVLSQLTREPIAFEQLSRRIFVGNAAIHFRAELNQAQGALLLTFSRRVDPQVSTQGNSVHLLFSHDGVVSSTENWKYEGAPVSSATFTETDGGPELNIEGTQPLLATFSNNGTQITVGPAPAAKTAAANPPTTAPTGAPAETPPGAAASANPAATPNPAAATAPAVQFSGPHPRTLIVLDAAHGGEERGAALSEHLAEKDITLAIARRLKTELQDRGVPVIMVRDSDATLSLDDRAMAANAAHGALYIAIHAATLGRGVRLYTAMVSPAVVNTAFVPWEQAQAGAIVTSRKLGDALIGELDNQSLDFPVALAPAPVRPLNNIVGAALAVEVSPLNGSADALASANYQQEVAVALAAAIAKVHPEAGQ